MLVLTKYNLDLSHDVVNRLSDLVASLEFTLHDLPVLGYLREKQATFHNQPDENM
jgi:hypothetical protein